MATQVEASLGSGTLAAARAERPRARRWRLNTAAWTGLALLVGLGLAALLAPLIAPYDPRLVTGRPFDAPSATHLLGTNDIGQDILSELIWGARVSLLVGILAALVSTAIGTGLGTLSGYARGAVDAALMRLVDVVLVIPFLPLMILLAAYLGPSLWNLVLVIGALLWARGARVIRAQALAVAEREYVLAARGLGAGHPRLLGRHVLPGVLSLALAELVQMASVAILLEASLSFLGLGDPIQKSWGSILFYAQARGAFLTGAWLWWVLPPGLCITLAVMGFALVGFAFEERVNPRLRR